MAWLLDTNVLSELRRPNPEPKVLEFIAGAPIKQLYLSSITLAEIRFGIEQAAGANDRMALTHWLANIARPIFKERILEVTENILLEWRLLVHEGRKTGHAFSQPDLFIAAMALHHNLTIVTRNEKDFSMTRASVFNPWAGQQTALST